VCRVYKGIKFETDIDRHSNFFDDLGNTWFTAKTPTSYKVILERIMDKCFIKNNYTGYEFEDPSTRIASCSIDDSLCDSITRISIIRNSMLLINSKEGVIDLLLEHTNDPILFNVVKKIYIRDMIKGSEWTIIEWFFVKDHNMMHRMAFARALVVIAYNLWKKHRKIVLYFDAVQKCGGRRSTDKKLENIDLNSFTLSNKF